MYKVYKNVYSLLLIKKFSTETPFIRNKKLPICSECVHFIEHTNNYPYDPITSNERYGKCKKFGEVNMITGIIENDFASDCRLDNNKCGKFALEYSKK
jgi:hypothetical protein